MVTLVTDVLYRMFPVPGYFYDNLTRLLGGSAAAVERSCSAPLIDAFSREGHGPRAGMRCQKGARQRTARGTGVGALRGGTGTGTRSGMRRSSPGSREQEGRGAMGLRAPPAPGINVPPLPPE